MGTRLSGVIRGSVVAGLLLAPSLAVVPTVGQDSTIVGVTVKPAEAQAGTPVNATAAGTGLCGAVHIDWGDGTEITYATSTLPVTQAHVYKAGGTYTVRAQGMGNCAGQATTRVNIVGPPPPPPAAPKLIAVELSAATVAPRVPVSIALRGEGGCRVDVDFGDGNSQELSRALPLTIAHTYALPGKYTIVATPEPRCGDRHRATLIVGAEPSVPRIAGIEVAIPPNSSDGMRAIRVTGAGRCAYTLDYGDGNNEGRNADLPDTVRHNYPASGRYVVIATPAPPCAGGGKAEIAIGGGRSGALLGIDISPRDAYPGQPVAVILRGSGLCRVTVDFGDEQQRELNESLPRRLTHRYAAAGDYEILAWTAPPCAGESSAAVRVRRDGSSRNPSGRLSW
jgi:hypothetical protein